MRTVDVFNKTQAKQSRRCPVCGASDSEAFRQVNMIVPDGFMLQHNYSINECNQCGGVFHDVDVQLDRGNYYSAYTGEGEHDYSISPDQSFLNDLTIDFLTKSSLSGTNDVIADVGCSYGVTLVALKEQGFSNLFAIDPDIAAIKYLENKGINGIIGSAEEVYPELEKKFDVVILRHVLEHLYEPSRAINNIAKWIKPNGKLYIELPDLSLYQETSPFPGYFFEYEHINHFSISSLVNLMSLNGFELIEYESSKEVYPCLRASFKTSTVLDGNQPIYHSDKNKVESSFNQLSLKAEKVIAKIEKLKSKEAVALWGVSIFVYRLLTHTSLKDINIQHLVDGNTLIQGAKILNLEIMSPTVLQGFSGTIVISGENSVLSIKSAIKKMGLTNEVICLMLDDDE